MLEASSVTSRFEMANSFVGVNRSYALLIGVGTCKYSQWSLPVTVQDVTEIEEVLVDPSWGGYPNDREHIRLLCDARATRAGILEELQRLAAIADRDPEATIVVYYSGHGWLNPADNSYYLITHDVDPDRVGASALAGADFTKALQNINSQKMLVILDCCHAEGIASVEENGIEFKLADGLNFKPPTGFVPKSATGHFSKLAEGKGVTILSSSDCRQLAWIRKDRTCSVFADRLIDALRGAGNQAGDREVTVMNLIDYLGKTVPETVRSEYRAEQQPQAKFKGSNNFPIALLCGGKGLPQDKFDEFAASHDRIPTSVTIAASERSIAIDRSARWSTIIPDDGKIASERMSQMDKDKTRIWQKKVERNTPLGSMQRFENVPGEMQPRKANKYQCLQCHRTGYREDRADRVPICPVHRLPMQSQGD
jgi:Caspase domain